MKNAKRKFFMVLNRPHAYFISLAVPVCLTSVSGLSVSKGGTLKVENIGLDIKKY